MTFLSEQEDDMRTLTQLLFHCNISYSIHFKNEFVCRMQIARIVENYFYILYQLFLRFKFHIMDLTLAHASLCEGKVTCTGVTLVIFQY